MNKLSVKDGIFFVASYIATCPTCGKTTHRTLKTISDQDETKCAFTFCCVCGAGFRMVVDPAKCLLCNECELYMKVVVS